MNKYTSYQTIEDAIFLEEQLNIDNEINKFQAALNGKATNEEKIKYIFYFTDKIQEYEILFRSFFVEKYYRNYIPMIKPMINDEVRYIAKGKVCQIIEDAGGNLKFYFTKKRPYYVRKSKNDKFPKIIKLLDYITNQYLELLDNISENAITPNTGDKPEKKVSNKKSELKNIKWTPQGKENFISIIETFPEFIESDSEKYCINKTTEEAYRYVVSLFVYAEGHDFMIGFTGNNEKKQWTKYIIDNFNYKISEGKKEFTYKKLSSVYSENFYDNKFSCIEYDHIDENF